jgi:hypothetical protein
VAKYEQPIDRSLQLSKLEFTFYTLRKNYNDLIVTHDKYFKQKKQLNILNFEQVASFIPELTRNLHNYLAAYSSFVDHSRKVSQQFPEFHNLYKSELEKRQVATRTSFIKELRNFALHDELPIVGLRVSFVHLKDNSSLTEPSQVIKEFPSIKTSDLLQHKLKKNLREFLERQPEEMPLIPYIKECQELTSELYQWFCANFIKF